MQNDEATRNKNKNFPVWAAVCIDFLIAALLLCVFAYFHHIRQYVLDADGGEIGRDESISWKEKFADHFTDTVKRTDNSYSSPNIAFMISEYRNESDSCTYYVADIYISSLDCLKSYFAGETYGQNITEKGLDMYESSGAVLAINGDYYGARSSGIVIRNSKVYRSSCLLNQDVCVLYSDGTMDTFLGAEFSLDDAIKDKAYQAWAFGPSLLDDDGKALDEYPSWYSKIGSVNPRSAIGYFEPGHYCFIAIDGRTDESSGMTFIEMSELMEKLGCTVAYNLDGGISSFMVYEGRYINIPPVDKYPTAPRAISDCIILKEPTE